MKNLFCCMNRQKNRHNKKKLIKNNAILKTSVTPPHRGRGVSEIKNNK
jgi:hypothetical protein